MMPNSVLITGGATRIGASIAEFLHSKGFNITVHYHTSESAAQALVDRLHLHRPNSAICIKADLCDLSALNKLTRAHLQKWQQLSVLINNASRFYPTPLESASLSQWDDLINSNIKAPFFLSQCCIPHLKKSQGCIINLIDIYAEIGIYQHPIYGLSKSALAGLTRCLAKDCAPDVRVNGVSPGNILWPTTHSNSSLVEEQSLHHIPLQRQGHPNDIAEVIHFLITQTYITGQIISVDGGKRLLG